MAFGFRIAHNEFKKSFFDRPAVRRRINRGNTNAKARSGALVRKIAQRSIRKRKKKSKPGDAPSSHRESGHRLRENIFFAHDSSTGAVVIGPSALKTHIGSGGVPQRGLITESLEYGGTVGVEESRLRYRQGGGFKVGKWYPNYRTGRRRPDTQYRVRYYRVKARPYMGPALIKAGPQLAKFWKNSVKE